MNKAIMDFSAIATTDNADMNLCVDSFTQTTKLELDQKGTRASALTMSLMVSCLSGLVHREIKFDRPFMYMIIENDTKLPIFVGTVKNDEALCKR